MTKTPYTYIITLRGRQGEKDYVVVVEGYSMTLSLRGDLEIKGSAIFAVGSWLKCLLKRD